MIWLWSCFAAGLAVGPVVDQPWGMLEFELRDRAGYLLRVGQNV